MRLKKEQVATIKELIAQNKPQPEIAAEFKVSRSLISDIATERLHKEVAWPEGYQPVHKKAGGQRKKLAEYDPTDERVMELEADMVHLQEELAQEKRRVKAGAKIAGLFKAVTREMDARIQPFAALPPALDFRRKSQITEDCVLHLSDGHHDQVVRPEEVGGLEDYNFPISCARG